MSSILDVHPVAIGPHLETELEIPEALAERGGMQQLRVHLPAHLPADAELPRRFTVMLRIPPGSSHGRCIKINGHGATDDAGNRGDLYVVLKLADAEALSSTSTPPPPPAPSARPPAFRPREPEPRPAAATPQRTADDRWHQTEEEQTKPLNEAEAAQVAELMRLHRAKAASGMDDEEKQAAQGCFSLLLALVVAATLGGASKFAHINSAGEWWGDTLPALGTAIVALIVFTVLGKMAGAAFGEGAGAAAQVLATGGALGLLLAPAWAWATHDKDWRTVLTAKILPGLTEREDEPPKTVSKARESAPTDKRQMKARPLETASRPAREASYVNTLGMKFVPVPGSNILMCVHETRHQDYAAYYAERTRNISPGWKEDLELDTSRGKFTFKPKAAHPVVNVAVDEAKLFCLWLSKKEDLTYRLPSDHEWSLAVDIGHLEDPATQPIIKGGVERGYPWGPTFPPSKNKVGNYWDITATNKFGSNRSEHDFGVPYNDETEVLSDVMRYPPNKLGIYDLGGNVREMCQDLWSSSVPNAHVTRGGSWRESFFMALTSSSRSLCYPGVPSNDVGFRCVIELRR